MPRSLWYVHNVLSTARAIQQTETDTVGAGDFVRYGPDRLLINSADGFHGRPYHLYERMLRESC
jgi:hypothetical protein